MKEPRGAEPTRQALLAAGKERFAERGFEGATVEAIASRAGVNKAMISYHFGGKLGLYSAILAGIFSVAARRLETLRDAPLRADAKLASFIEIFTDMVESEPALPAMILREILSGGRHLDEAVLPEFLKIFGHVREIVDQGIREGSLRPVNPLLTHLTLVGSLVFYFGTRPLRERLIAEGKLPPVGPAREAFTRHLTELITRGLAAAPRPGPARR